MARKATWLYAVRCALPDLVWGASEQRLAPVAVARHGYEKARRSGVMAYVGGKDKAAIRAATPPVFRDVLIEMARSVVPTVRGEQPIVAPASPPLGILRSLFENAGVVL